MELGRYIDGRSVVYEASNGTFKIGDLPATTVQIRAFLSAGHIAWTSPEIATWFNRSFPAPVVSAAPPAKTGRAVIVIAVMVAALVMLLLCGIMTAIAIPVFSAARLSAQAKSCWASERAVEGAAQTYNAERGSMPQTIDALSPEYMAVPKCPAGGTYLWDPKSGRLTCSKHGNYSLNPTTGTRP